MRGGEGEVKQGRAERSTLDSAFVLEGGEEGIWGNRGGGVGGCGVRVWRVRVRVRVGLFMEGVGGGE